MHSGGAGKPGGGRKAEALAYIVASLDAGHSPAMADVARALKVSRTRSRSLIKALTDDGSIVRTPGAQRAIRVSDVGRARAAASAPKSDAVPCPKAHGDVVAIITHVPDRHEQGIGDDDRHFEPGGTAADRASRVRPSTPQAAEEQPQAAGASRSARARNRGGRIAA
jgi:SOS-response transcriptional repressor LexA